MATAQEKSSTLAKLRRRVAANVKGKKRCLNNLEEENTQGGKERRTMGVVVEHRQAFRTIDNRVVDKKTAVIGRSSKSCTEQQGRLVGIVPPQAAVKSEPIAGDMKMDNESRDFAREPLLADIPTKKSRRGRGPPFAIQVPRQITHAEQSISMQTLGSVIDTLMSPPENVLDIDKDDTDVFMHSEYHSDIIGYLKGIENKYAHYSIEFLETGVVTPHMRTILVDWLVQVQIHLALADETLHLTVALIDRYLSKKVTHLSKFQLLGISSLFVASKFTERFAPEVDVLVHLTDNTYNYQQVLDMEIDILSVLKFDLNFADPYQFLERFLKAACCNDDIVRFTCMYLIDLSLIDARCIVYKPSTVAAAALCLVRQIFSHDISEPPWTATLAYYSEYRLQELIPCMRRLAWSVVKLGESRFTAAQEKYSDEKYHRVSRRSALISSHVLSRLASEIGEE